MISGRTVIVLFYFFLLADHSYSQRREAMDLHRSHEVETWREMILRSQNHISDSNIDVKFYHLDIEIAIDSAYIAGNVLCRFEPVQDGLDELFLDLHGSLIVTSISAPAESYYQENDKIIVNLDRAYDKGEQITLLISYSGQPVLAGGAKGLRYETHNGDEPVIATLSTPYLAHYWYPCKDGPEDKADSVFVDITIQNREVNGLDLIAVSNGVLEDTIISPEKKTFQWRHRYPIVTYYVMAAISNYVVYEDEYMSRDDLSFPLQYFFFDEQYTAQLDGVNELPEVISFFNDIFGPYPFANEKYGMTQLGFYGAIENQTNVIQNTMSPAWFLITVHELAHMWFGDMITCETWNHGWLNEGFATYAEALWVEHAEGTDAYRNYMQNLQYFGPGTLYLQETDDPFKIFIPIIYNKGAWTLHMLRGVVGDSLFFQSLESYSADTNFIYQNANTEELQEVFENVTGSELDYFFDQWVYDAYYPIYAYNFVQESDKRLFVSLYQAQEELYDRRPVFEMPVPIRITYSDGNDSLIVVENNEQIEQYIFDLDKTIENVEIDPEQWILREVFFWDELPVGLAEKEARKKLTVSPNPAGEEVHVEIDPSIDLPLLLKIIDLNGNVIKTRQINRHQDHIDLLGQPPGIYFIQILNKENNPVKTIKLLKK